MVIRSQLQRETLEVFWGMLWKQQLYHPVDLRYSHQGSPGSSLTAEGNWKSCHVLWWPSSCGTALVSGCQLQSCHFPVDSLSREEKRLRWRKQMSFPPSMPQPSSPWLGKLESTAGNHPSQSVLPELHSEVFRNNPLELTAWALKKLYINIFVFLEPNHLGKMFWIGTWTIFS